MFIFFSSLVAQTVKNLPAVQETWVQSLGGEDPLEKGQGASRAAPGKSGLHACGQADRVIALESWEGLGPQDEIGRAHV